MTRLRLALLFLFALGAPSVALAGRGASLKVIRQSDLADAIKATSIATIRRMEPTLSASQFHDKIKSALRSPMHLKQTFPGLLGTMVKPLLGTAAMPGKVVPIGFDDHIENTGVVRVGKDDKGRRRSIETIIDLDDAGLGPAGLEALSIGTALEQAGYKRKVLTRAARTFAAAATGEEQVPLDVKGPRWGKLRRDWMKAHTRLEDRGGRQVLSLKGTTRASAETYRAVERVAKHDGFLSHYEVLDIASHAKTDGGSGGLIEYELLAREHGKDEPRVFLLKEQNEPGSAQLGLPQASDAGRLDQLEAGLWKDVPKGVFFYMRGVSVPGRDRPIDLLARDKLAIVGNVASGSNAKETALRVARLYGREHAGQFGGLGADELSHWMEHSTKAVSRGFETLRKQLRSELKTWTPE